MNHRLIRAGLLACISLLSAVIAWLSGYDFDHRGQEVAAWFAVTLVIAVALSSIPLDDE